MDGDQSKCAPSKNLPLFQVSSGIRAVDDCPAKIGVTTNNLDGDREGFIDVPSNSNIDRDTKVPKRASKKLTSEVWLYFAPIEVNGIKKAKCKSCKGILSNNSLNGNSHLRKHFKSTCPMRALRNSLGQTKLRTKTEVDGTTTLELKEKHKDYCFEQDFSRDKLVTMIIMHEYPLSMVDHVGFRDFVKSINPSFKMISRNTLRSDILNMFKDEKISLKGLLLYNDSRIAVTTDMWTASTQKKGYMAVTAHFIDKNWILRNRTLRFCFVPCPHTKGVLAKVLMECMSQYGLERKLSSIVVDNCTTNDAMMKILLKQFEKKCLVLGGKFLHLRCSAHILNLIVKDGLDVIDSAISKVRDCVSFWMSTPKRMGKFEEACCFLGISYTKRMVLDCKTRWNATFYMLRSAFPYNDVFEKLKRLNKKLKFEVPSEEEWDLAKIICDKLEIFDIATKVFSGRHYPTSNLFFRKACEIKLVLRSWLRDDIEIVRNMAINMMEKFDKYWEHISGILAVGAILDPKNKMECVAYYFDALYGSRSEREVDKVRNLLDEI